MLRTLLATFLIAFAPAMAEGATAHQSGDDTGTLIVQEFVDVDNNGLYEPDDTDGFERARVCRIIVYRDLTDTILPHDWNGALDTRIKPLTEGETDKNGIARFELSAGRYSIDRGFCEDFELSRSDGAPICCPDRTASPSFVSISGEPGYAPLKNIQTVDIVAGETTIALVRYHPRPGISTLQTVTAIATWIMLGALVFWLWRRYPVIRADYRNPMRLQPKERDHRPATWDDVFGEFVRRKKR